MPTDYAKNVMLSALAPDSVSLHTAFPGSTGANEVPLGAYARQTPSLGAYSGGVRVAASNTWNVQAGITVRWVGYWQGVQFLEAAPNGGVPKEFVATPSNDTITCTGHGYANDTTVVFYNGTPPDGLVEGTVYYVRDATTDTFKVAATAGGTAIGLNTAGATGCQVSAIVQDVYASAGTHTIDTATFGAPF